MKLEIPPNALYEIHMGIHRSVCQRDPKKAGGREDIDITGDEFKEWVLGKWSFPQEIRMKDYDHPAMFPEELPRRLMKLFSYKNDIVLDPFNGAGNSSLVAWKLGRGFIGIDVSRQYCDTALARIEMAAGGTEQSPDYPSPKLLLQDDLP